MLFRSCQNRQQQIHLMLTDVLMPRLNGPDLARRLRSSRPGMRVLFMSGYSERLRLELDGESAFIQKPFSVDALASKIREVLDSPETVEGV